MARKDADPEGAAAALAPVQAEVERVLSDMKSCSDSLDEFRSRIDPAKKQQQLRFTIRVLEDEFAALDRDFHDALAARNAVRDYWDSD